MRTTKVFSLVVLMLVLAGTLTGRTVSGAPSFQVASPARVVVPQALSNLPAETYRLLVDTDNHVWFALLQCCHENQANTLNEFDLSTNSLKSWPLPGEFGNGFLSGMSFGPDGAIWMGWNYLLVRFDLKSKQAKSYRLPPAGNVLSDQDKGTYVTDLALTADGVVWLARNNDVALTRLNPATGQFEELAIPGLDGDPFRLAVLGDGRVAMSTHHSKSSSTGYGQVVVYDPSTGKSQSFSARASEVVASPQYGLLLDGAERAGIGVTQPGGIRDLATNAVVKQPPPFPHLAVDASGDLWYAESGGRQIASFNPRSQAVTSYNLPMQEGMPTRLHAMIVNTPLIGDLVPDKAGRMWFSIANYHQIGYVEAQ